MLQITRLAKYETIDKIKLKMDYFPFLLCIFVKTNLMYEETQERI